MHRQTRKVRFGKGTMIKDNKMPKAVTYTRVSTQEQVEGYSLEFQEKFCKDLAEKQGLKITRVFREKGASAKTVSGRPVLRSLLEFCKNKENNISNVLVYKYDRWSRNTADGLTIMAILAKQGIEVISATEPAENNAMGKAIRSMLLVMAEFENNQRAEKTTDGMKAAIEAGRWPWKAPIGYVHKLVNEKKAIVLIKGFKEILSRFFTEAATGVYTKSQLADKLNAWGFSKLWGSSATDKTTDKILQKKFYCGILEAKKWGIERPGIHTPVTDEEIWFRAYQNVYQAKQPRKTGNNDELFPLRGFILCGSCGKSLTGSFSTGNGGRYPYYHCAHKGCFKPTRASQENLHKLFVEELNQFTLSPVQSKLLQVKLTQKIERKIRLYKREEENKQLKVERLKTEKRDVLRSNARGLIDDDEARKLLEDLRDEEAVLRLEDNENRIDQKEAESVLHFIQYLTENMGRFWNQSLTPQKRRFQSLIFPEGTTYDGEKLRTTEIAESFRLIKSYSVSVEPLVSILEKIRTHFDNC